MKVEGTIDTARKVGACPLLDGRPALLGFSEPAGVAHGRSCQKHDPVLYPVTRCLFCFVFANLQLLLQIILSLICICRKHMICRL